MAPMEHPAARFQSGKILLPTGVTLHYIETGDQQEIPTIFLHGYIDSWVSFSEVLAALPPRLHAVAPDLRGHGDSDKPSGRYTMPDFTEDLIALMDALGCAKANIVGHSLGSFIAQSLAGQCPERVNRLILISSAPAAKHNALLREIKPQIEALQDPIDREFIVEFQSPANPIAKRFFERLIAESLKVPAHVWQAAFRGLLETDHTATLKNITAPTLIVWGNQDQLFQREEQDKLLALISDALFKEYDAGHALLWEQPQQLAADIEHYLVD